jgi:transcription initiation factor TFIIA large subunit
VDDVLKPEGESIEEIETELSKKELNNLKRKRFEYEQATSAVQDAISSDSENGSLETEPTTSNLILTQFEKVVRTKNKWKCVFKDGIMLVNGSEHTFGKCNAEFLW